MVLMPHFVFQRGTGPIVAAAIHNGHDTRKRVQERLAIDENQQLREEDPITGELSQIAKVQIVGLRSRFEVDLNRPRDQAVYRKPEDAWGLELWKSPPDEKMIQASLKEYDLFYDDVEQLLRTLVQEHGHVVVYDLHTYNHQRQGPDGPLANPRENPEVNIGTGTMDRGYWGPVVDRLMDDLRQFSFHGRHLDVRENVKFLGGHFVQWIHQTFPRQVCGIAIEFKKFFMDEWNNTAPSNQIEGIYHALQSTLPGVEEELRLL